MPVRQAGHIDPNAMFARWRIVIDELEENVAVVSRGDAKWWIDVHGGNGLVSRESQEAGRLYLPETERSR